WRRGISVKFVNEHRRKSELSYELSFGEKIHTFTVAKGDLVTNEAMNICRSKDLTKDYLLKAGVPIPQGKIFNGKDSDEKIVNYADTLKYPVVLKPADGTGGKGVIANIQGKKQFEEALQLVKYELGFKNLIVE